MESNENNDDSNSSIPYECCGNGCNSCILDIHREYIKKPKHIKSNNSIETSLLSMSSYKIFEVINVKPIADGFIILKVKCNIENGTNIIINPGQHVILQYKQISRPLTPISWSVRSIKFVIKIYTIGEFSNQIKSINEGDIVKIRGPYGNFNYESNSFKYIIMICIGSGICAVYPIIQQIIRNEFEETRIQLIVGFRSLSQVPFKKQLQDLSGYWNFKCTICLSQKNNDNNNLHGIDVINSCINNDLINEKLKSIKAEETLILICGTIEFNKIIKELMEKMQFSNVHIFS